MIKYIFIALFAVVCLVGAFVLARPKSKVHTVGVCDTSKNNFVILVVLILTIVMSVSPMGLSPVWNGKLSGHRNQYEKMAESFMKGQLYFDDEVDEELLALENPYDPELREEAGVEVMWDHALYNGRYYMYFGVVPVILVFLPFRAITGASLTSYIATGLFTAVYIAGVFAVFYSLAKKFFKNITLGMYLFLSVAVSFMSVWCAISTPALYCTAITAGLAMMMWGLFFWIKAVWDCKKDNKSLLFATVGSLLGALAFGCRPPVALGNFIILALIIYYIKNRKGNKKYLYVLISLLPYLVVGVLLMWYNYARFGSILEFGQSYQMTIRDINSLPTIFNQPSLKGKLLVVVKYLSNMGKYLFRFSGFKNYTSNGIFLLFPMLFYIVIGLEQEGVRRLIAKNKSKMLVGFMLVTPLIILLTDVIGSPDVICRYHMDTYWVLGLLMYFFIGLYYQQKSNKRRFSVFICMFSILTILTSALLVAFPVDYNFTHWVLIH